MDITAAPPVLKTTAETRTNPTRVATSSARPTKPNNLSALAVSDLERSRITPEQAELLGMFSVENAKAIAPLGEFRAQPALVIPYFDARGELVYFDRDGESHPFCRVRYLGDLPAQKASFSAAPKRGKYGQAARSGARAYFPACITDWVKIASDSATPILFVEGEKKAALAALLGYTAIGIGGAWNGQRQGTLAGTKQLLAELEAFIWKGRLVVLALDGDASTNPAIAAAENWYALELGLRRGAVVHHVRFPFDGTQRMGLDDYFAAYGLGALEKLLAGAEKMREADALVAELNQEYAIVCMSGKTFVAHFGSEGRVAFYSKKDFELRLENRFALNPVNNKSAPLAKVWLTHPERRQYLGGVAFEPLRTTPPDTLNLWRGFSVEPKPGDWSLLRTHIWENICSEETVLFDYLMNWLARLVQQPGEPGEVAIVMRGDKGTGKSKFAYWVGQLMRDHFVHATQTEHVVGRFNSHLLNAIVLVADEAFFAGDPKTEKTLNGLITEKDRVSEQKFMPAITVPNYLHMIMATNSEWAIPATWDERRYFVVEVSDAHKQDSHYFAAIDAQMKAGGLAAMLDELQRRDISKFEVRRVPKTAALAEQQLKTLHGRGEVAGWVYDFLSAGEIRSRDAVHYWSQGELQISKTEARSLYDAWSAPRNRRPIDPRQFGREMRWVLGTALAERRPRATAGQRQDGGRPEVYVLRSLEECREAYRVALAKPDLWREQGDG